jgi:hypothetical protein
VNKRPPLTYTPTSRDLFVVMDEEASGSRDVCSTFARLFDSGEEVVSGTFDDPAPIKPLPPAPVKI